METFMDKLYFVVIVSSCIMCENNQGFNLGLGMSDGMDMFWRLCNVLLEIQSCFYNQYPDSISLCLNKNFSEVVIKAINRAH
jgi:hypothetical protein